MNKSMRKLSVRRTTMRVLSPTSLRGVAAAAGTDVILTRTAPKGDTTMSADIEGGCGEGNTVTSHATSCNNPGFCVI
jgi:hypothetical protein